MMSLAAAGCGGGGGGGATASNTSGNAGQSGAPAPVSPFTPPAATPSPTPTPTEDTPPVTAPPATPPAQAPGAGSHGVTLAWELPTETSSGAPLGTLAGYHIHYGNDAAVLSETIIVDNPGVLSYVLDTLPPGTYYFAVRAVTIDGDKSALSNVISKVIG